MRQFHKRPLRAALLAALLIQLPLSEAAPDTAPAAVPASAIDPSAVIPVGPQVKVGKLDNGLTYYIQNNGKPEHRLELRLVVKAGSVLEDEDQRGLAHFLEHMAFQGSTHFEKHQLVSYLQSIGVKFGADLNAYTSFDETVYMLPVPTENRDNVEQGFTVLEDWAHGLRLDDADIDKERGVVLEEARLGKGAGERIRKVLMPKLFNGSRYAERLPIGQEDVIRNAKPEALRRFYRDWYRPDLMAVVVVGDIEPAQAERLIKAHFAGLKNPAKERTRTYPEIPPLAGTEALVVTDKEIGTNSVSLRYPLRYAPDRGTYGEYREQMVERMFGLMLSQRLGELAQQPAPPFMGAGAGVDALTPSYKGYTASASLGAGGAGPAIAALLQEQQRVRQYGFTAPELERVRKAILHGLERAYNERNTTNSSQYVDEYTRNFLTGEEIGGIEAEYRLAQAILPAIGVAEVDAFARKTIPADAGKLVLYIGGEGKGAPAPGGAQLLLEAAAAERAPVSARAEKQLASELMARPGKPGSIVEESKDERIGLTRLTLSNGVKVILKPTDFQKDQVMLAGYRQGGQTLFEPKDLPNVRYATTIAAAMGLKDFAPLDLQKILAGRSANAGVTMGEYADMASGFSGSSAQDVETMFQLLWLRFDAPRRDQGLYQSFMGKQQEILRNRLATPEARFGDVLVDTLYARHPYEPHPLTLDDANRVDLDRSLGLYRQRFASAKGMTFVLVGDFELEKIKPLLAAYLGTLPTTDLPLAYRDVGLRTARGVIKKEVQAGSEPKSTASITFSGPAAWSPAESLRMSALMEIMNLRIMDVLREKLGLIYTGSMHGAVDDVPYEHYSVSATLPTGPEKVDAAIAALFAEIERMKTQGPEQADLDKYKRNWHVSHARALRENSAWFGNLLFSVMHGTDAARIVTIEKDVDALTAADVQKAAQRYFDMNNYVQVVLNPETAAAKVANTGKQ
jgi:zinc protease